MNTEIAASPDVSLVPPPEVPAATVPPAPVKPPFGFISLHMDGGRIYSGTQLMRFDRYNEMNEYFEEHTGLLVVTMFPMHGLTGSHILALVATGISDEEREELMAYQQDLNRLRDERHAAKNAAKEHAAIAEAKRLNDERELQALGRKCRENHGAVLEDNHKLRKENKRLKGGTGADE